jgi:hypothetical protein
LPACARRSRQPTSTRSGSRSRRCFEAVYIEPSGLLLTQPKADMHREGGRWQGSVSLPLKPRATCAGTGVPLCPLGPFGRVLIRAAEPTSAPQEIRTTRRLLD